MTNVTATLRPARTRHDRRNAYTNLGAIAQEMARYAPDVTIRVLGADGRVTAVFGAGGDDITLF